MSCIEPKSNVVMEPRLPEKTPVDRRNGKHVKENAIPPQGVYLPNNNYLAPHMVSPEYVQLSNAAAITLGIMGGRMHRCECTRCLNLLLTYPEGCRANCAYCGLARHREADRDYADRNFIRVDWPAVPMAEIIDIVARDPENSPFHRMCISMITHPRSEADTFTILKQWTDKIDPHAIPVSILSNPTTMTREDVQKTKDLGADIFTVALDAATPAVFDRTRGKGVQSPHKWKKYWDIMLEAKDIFGPQKFGAHIIVGMGETENEVPMPTILCAPNFCGPKISFASSMMSQYFFHLCGDCTPLPRVRSNSSGVAASSATVNISAPRSLVRCTSSRVIVVGLDRMETGIAPGSILSVHCSSTSKVSCSDRGCVIIEMHMR